jgi:hypothetical protein
MQEVHGVHITGNRSIQMERVASRTSWSNRIFPETNGNCHPSAQEHTGSHRRSVGTHQGSRTAVEDLGSVIHPAKKTRANNQPSQVNVLLAGSRILRIQNQSRRSSARNRSPEGYCRHSTSEGCSGSQTISGTV